jgi:chemotaxis protein MotA
MAFASLAVSVLMEGGSLRSLVNMSAALIVFGGSLGATLVAMPLGSVLRLPSVLKHALFAPQLNPGAVIELMGSLARVARREGVLALEGEMLNIQDAFIRRGVQLVVDGTDTEVTQGILETEIAAQSERHELGRTFFTTIGGLTPTLGVTGTVMGLVHMLGQLNDPGSMGPAIAAAFLATLYGVASANLIFLPIAGKLKLRSQQEKQMREMIALGIEGLQTGDSPLVLMERLKAYLAPGNRAVADQAAGGQGAGAGETVGAQA